MTKLATELDSQGRDCIPATFVFPGPDEHRFQEYASANPGATYIAKPNDAAGGESIYLFHSLRDIPQRLMSTGMTV